MPLTHFWINGEKFDRTRYGTFHDCRMATTLAALREMDVRRVIELGGHPWVMTSHLVDSGEFEVCATVSAEEVTNWPDDIEVTKSKYHLRTESGNEANFLNYSANLERRLFDIPREADAVIACEIIEHLIRSPHIMLLNMNHWLPVGGKILLTTPNGSQFRNPLRLKSWSPGYRCQAYARHNHVYTMDKLVDLISLCGFHIEKACYWDPYPRSGVAKLYGVPARVPLKWFEQRFKKVLCIVATKEKHVDVLERTPQVYVPDDEWEYIANER
jgi:hypothetical protein